MKFRHAAMVVAILALPVTAQAQSTPGDKAEAAADTAPPATLTVSGSAAIASDYRFRGVSQSDRHMAVQGGITVSHESGLYAGVWGSNLAGWGTFGGANMELDLIGGYKAKLADNATLDAGLTWYMYPGGADNTDFAEPYAKLSGTAGPATLTAGVAYAPKQQAIGKWYATGADATWHNLTFNVSYIDTDISGAEVTYLRPSFSKGQDGSGNIAGGTIVASLTAAF